ncbi:MAG: sialidase family protein [Chloroflexota bacterium]
MAASIAALLTTFSWPGPATAAGGWVSSVAFTNQVASTPTTGGGYPIPAGSRVPDAGTCGPGPFNANHSESWIAVKPGTDNLVGSSKFFFDKYSTFYMFYLGAHQIRNGTPSGNNQIQGYDCLSTGTQDMPPSWTDTTDPNLDFDTKGRVYQTMLPFNAFWDASRLHPDGEIDVSYSDDLGAHWVKGNGGRALEPPNNASARQVGHVEDKQWIAVNHIVGNVNQDHVYAAWAVFNGTSTKTRIAVSRDRGLTFDHAVTLSAPSQVGAATTYVLPEIDSAGVLYVAVVSFPPNGGGSTIYVTRSNDDGRTFAPFVAVATPTAIPTAGLPNTRFRDGITESFAASPTHPGHLYLAYEDWSTATGQMDIKFTQSTDAGLTWSTPVKVNDNVDAPGVPTDQFQPAVAAGPGGVVAVEFYDRRQACPNDPSILPADVGRTNFCIDATLQAYKDAGSGASPVQANLRVTKFTWDPEQPGQHLGGLSQYPCAGARDPCPDGRGFIGDYFGLAISGKNIYGLFVSTHYPSNVTADEGGQIYYQQQVLSTVSRADLGI